MTSSSDAEYTAFLESSQKDYSGGGGGSVESGTEAGVSSSSGTAGDVHVALKELGERYYVSEVDGMFTPVSFLWSGHHGGDMPSEDEFRTFLLLPTAAAAPQQQQQGTRSITTLDPNQWDVKGEYKDVIEAVSKATAGPVRVYRVEGVGSRVEYFIVGREEMEEKEGHRIVGVKVLAVES